MEKSTFTGKIISIQPRIRLTRSFDESSHTYLGYAIKLEGQLDGEETIFSIGIGKAVHAKHQFKVNDVISGECVPVPDPDMEPVDYYKVSKLKVISKGEQGSNSSPWCRFRLDLASLLLAFRCRLSVRKRVFCVLLIVK